MGASRRGRDGHGRRTLRYVASAESEPDRANQDPDDDKCRAQDEIPFAAAHPLYLLELTFDTVRGLVVVHH